jgi:hypothetical protein
MSITLRKDDGIACNQAYRRLITKLYVALAFCDQMEDHDTLGTWLQQRRSRVGARGLITPGGGEPRVDEDGTY